MKVKEICRAVGLAGEAPIGPGPGGEEREGEESYQVQEQRDKDDLQHLSAGAFLQSSHNDAIDAVCDVPCEPATGGYGGV